MSSSGCKSRSERPISLGANVGAGVSVTPTRPIARHLDTLDGAANGCLLAITRHLDGVKIPDGGIPAPVTYSAPGFGNGLASPQFGQPTLHETMPRPHCAMPGRYEVPLFAEDVVELAVLRNRCNAWTEAGVAPPACACVLTAASLVVTSLDSSWTPSGACWWEADGGSLPAPQDDYDGSTP